MLNNKAVHAAADGNIAEARRGLHRALSADPECGWAKANLTLLDVDNPEDQEAIRARQAAPYDSTVIYTRPPIKVAILSFLFNWPSTGGGIVHTIELSRFLGKAGYEVRHFCAHYDPWGIGRVESGPLSSEVLKFTTADWNIATIQRRFRDAVDEFGADLVLITDCWNFKPWLVQAMQGYPTFLRFQALECLCPLNHVRLLYGHPGHFAQCPRHQLATPEVCHRCVQERGHHSGSLHQLDRALARVGTAEYDQVLRQALQDAEAVLVLNPVAEAMISPYARRTMVVTWGMDPERFPWPWHEPAPAARTQGPTVIFQAGLPDEPMKGFPVLHAACELLWRKRQDFELVVTGQPAGRVDAFTRFTGWLSQADLPRQYHAADIVAVPTVAQEGLSRTSVEAMACGKPVVASRIGGVPFTVADGATGLLCEPGEVGDVARKLELLLDDRDLRQRLGLAGRRRFEQEFTWDVVIERSYRPLFVAK